MNQIPVGERILEERSRNRFTQEELARRLGVSKAAVSKWECGQSMPDIALLPKIASLFSITLDDLLGYEPVAAEEVREETRRQLAELLAEDIRRACDYAEDRAALYWSDPELLRTVGLLLYTRFIELADADEPGGAEGTQPVAELAERLLRRTLQLDPSSPSADLTLQTLCMLLAFEGRDGQAAELVERMVAAKPNMAAVTLAGVQVKAGDSEAGVRTLKRQLRPGSGRLPEPCPGGPRAARGPCRGHLAAFGFRCRCADACAFRPHRLRHAPGGIGGDGARDGRAGAIRPGPGEMLQDVRKPAEPAAFPGRGRPAVAGGRRRGAGGEKRSGRIAAFVTRRRRRLERELGAPSRQPQVRIADPADGRAGFARPACVSGTGMMA